MQIHSFNYHIMKKTLLLLWCFVCTMFHLNAQTWTAPVVPGEDLAKLTSDQTVYFYNVETDAFFINGMTWGMNACATRLTNGDKAASEPQRCSVKVANGKASISLKNFSNNYLSCLSEDANDVYVDQAKNYEFTYTETTAGSHVYTLKNTAYNKDLDVTWKYGGHITLVGGGGYTQWAFIPETAITDGSYALYKAKKQLYNVYKAICDAGKESTYINQLSAAYTAYTASDATEERIIEAARTLFKASFADLQGPLNVSFLFDTPDMAGAATVKAWTTESKNIGWGEFEVYHAAFTLSQNQNVPMGLYDVVLHALYRQDGSDEEPTLTATASNIVSQAIPQVGSIDYQVTNTNNNNWKAGDLYNQPNGMQSCAQALTHDDAVAVARNVIVNNTGSLTISVNMTSGSQWLNWQGVELIYKGIGTSSLTAELSEAINRAEVLYGNGTGKGAAAFKAVIDEAKEIEANEDATMTAITGIISKLNTAMETYKKTSATINSPLDWTHLILNASFEKGLDNWSQMNFFTQSNTAFTYKDKSYYIEKWVGKGNAVGDASITQIIKDLDMGVYVLKVAAQNIQEGSTARQSNAWILTDNKQTEVDFAQEYSVVFTHIEKDMIIGFKAEGATGNWLTCDNFRLYYAGGEESDYKTAMQGYINDANALVDKKMQAPVREALESAIATGETGMTESTLEKFPTYATNLRQAKENAMVSIAAFEQLQKAIDEAVVKYGDGSLKGAQKFLAAINQAKAVNEDLNSTIAQMEEEEENLSRAAFTYQLDNGSGAAPKVTTDPRFVRGSSSAYGRLTYSGVSESSLQEVGFCWSTQPNPTIHDNRSTAYYDWNGKIYRMEGLQPATVYYVRAYALTKTFAVGYGEVLKIITIPRGQCSYSYNWGGDADANQRIDAAGADATNYYNNFTSIKGYHSTINYGSGTPTADCSYGGWMRVGPNASYQRTGTIMHEMAHGVGVGTHYIWYGYSPLRETGYRGLWLGERANKVLQFFDNNNNSMMTGDETHMWPFGINGAHEDHNNPIEYMINAMIIQGLCEDGLIPTGGGNLPAYTLRSDDNVKYYIKNEDSNYGLNDSYLTETSTGTLKWVTKSNSEVMADDAYAWFVEFVPSTCYYRIKNAKSGKYFTYSSNSIKTASKTTPSSTENFQLMGGRVRATIFEKFEKQGFWVIVPQNKNTPPCLQANTNGGTTTASFNLENAATNQRWLFLSSKELEEFDKNGKEAYSEKLNNLFGDIKALLEVPHKEKAVNADATLSATLESIEQKALTAETTSEFQALYDEAKAASMTFLNNVTPTNVTQPFNITYMIENSNFDDDSGWTNIPVLNHSCGEFFEVTYNMTQTISDAPAGTYKLMMQGFQRPGWYETCYEEFINGTDNVNAVLYARSDKANIKHIASEAHSRGSHTEDIQAGNPIMYLPNTMLSAAKRFADGEYENEVVTTLTKKGALKYGLRTTEGGVHHWTCFDNFRLYFYGDFDKNTVTDIQEQVNERINMTTSGVYNLQGVKVGNSLQGLPKGIYIVNKKKVIVK